MFFINPDPFLLPVYRISPFTTEHIAINNSLTDDDFAVSYFDEKFGKGNWHYTYNGREALEMALQQYQLGPDDLVTVVTTSENYYISSCVTKSIERFCRWNREITSDTKVILVNHEFGYPYTEMDKLLATGLPIIEDCCTTFFSQDAEQRIGKYGDFAAYSFPKFFPVQIGGLLVSNVNNGTDGSLDDNEKRFVQNVMSSQLKSETVLLEKRRQNLNFAINQFSSLGFTPRFRNTQDIFPSALLLNNNSVVKDLNELKIFLAANGIQSSVFYGEDAFFVPCHQHMSNTDIEFIYACVDAFIKTNTKVS